MMLINYYHSSYSGSPSDDPDDHKFEQGRKVIYSMRGLVPPAEGSEIIFASPDFEHEAQSWEVVKVRNFHWFDSIEGRFEQAANVYVRET